MIMDENQDDFKALFPLCVFERSQGQARIPDAFSAATILLDAQASSALDWSLELKVAEDFIAQGKFLLFDFEFGISKPLSHLGQFQAASFAIAHFREECWPKFAAHTLGAILFRSHGEDVSALLDYAELLRGELPPSCEPFLLFDFIDTHTFITQFRPDRFSRFRVAVKNAPLHTSFAVWQEGKGFGGYIGKGPLYGEEDPPTIGILIPPIDQPIPPHVIDIIAKLPECKIIPESQLTIEWDGLEKIIIPYQVQSISTKRALDGFLAAGGALDEKAQDL
jgi:hypothetical protein